jgi:hypothetical protein
MDKLYRNAVPLIIVTGVIVVAATLWRMWPQPAPSGEYKFMHCEVCGFETAFNSKAVAQPCPHCKPPTIGRLVPTPESVVNPPPSPYRQLFAVLLIEGVCILGALVFLLYHPPPPPDAVYYYTHCPNLKCRRKMRYPASRAGAAAQCPLCKTTVINPTVEEQQFWRGASFVRRSNEAS